ncbi:MAG: Do family serine endopeptidase [Pseudomonadota bacterium]|nr:Do family serine endopeptidase [Pseudomonadota bacterium]
MTEQSSHFARRRPVLASAAALAIAASGVLALSMQSGSTAVAGAVEAPASVAASAPSFADVVSHVKPAVVSVRVNIQDATATEGDDSEGLDQLPPEMRQFFKRFGGSPNFGKPIVRHGVALGSGFIISADGYVVTNNHVVEHGGKTVKVTLDSGKEMDADVIGTDQKTDLAVLKIKGATDLPYVRFAKELPRIGDWVLAIGNPFGLGGTVTAGIVSAEGRDIGSGPYDQFIQIDAPINKGNSGGPTFNLKGEVVGVNTAIFSPTGGSVGLGFAIPADTVNTIVSELEHGGVKRGYLGVQIQAVTPEIADSLGLKNTEGALVAETQPDTPAAAAGLKSGDVIVKFNDEAVKSAGDLTRKVGAVKPGEKSQLTFIRDGQEKTASVTLATLDGAKVATAEHDDGQGKDALTLGLQLAPSDKGKGVEVVNVDPNGAAAAKGLSAGDVILEVAGKPVSTPQQVKAEIAAAKQDGKKAVLMLVRNDKSSRFVAFEFPKA